MTELALHPTTAGQLLAFREHPGHALCLIGPPGAGKGYTAAWLAEQTIGHKGREAILVLGGDQAIGIEAVRQLQQFLRLKRPGRAAIRRAVILENAHNMSDEAQNALLKTLEEPPADTIFILTTDGSNGLRPTIYSRTHSIRILPLTLEQAKQHFSHPDVTRAYHLSGGYAGLLHALLNDSDHHLVAAVEQAKQILQASPYERLLLVDDLAKKKDALPTLFYALQRVAGALLPATRDQTKLKRLTASLRALYQAETDAAKSANTKLLLTDLFLQL